MAELGKQLHVEVADEVGKMAQLTKVLAEAGVNIRAAVAWVEGANGHMRLVTDDNEKACDALGPLATACAIGDVVMASMPNEIGALNSASQKLSDAGIGIKLIYASASGGECLVALDTTDNAKAAEIL